MVQPRPNGLEYTKNKEAIQKEKEERIRAYREKAASRVRMAGVAFAGAQPLNLIAQGDSWFDYPIPWPRGSDVIEHLRAMPKSPLILNLAHHGEATDDMLGVHKLHELIEQLTDKQNGKFDAILFSAGGNDIAGDQFRLWLNDSKSVGGDPDKALRKERVDAILAIVRGGYEDLIAVRDTVAPGIPIFAHGYAFATPDGRGVCGAGPWLRPGLLDRGWEMEEDGKRIIRALMLQFAAVLRDIQANSSKFFVSTSSAPSLTFPH
jgi:hypothetical protein